MFQPTLGRWMQEDPIGFAGRDQNLYRFEGNQETGSLDPLGLQTPVNYVPQPVGPPVPYDPSNPWERDLINFYTYPEGKSIGVEAARIATHMVFDPFYNTATGLLDMGIVLSPLVPRQGTRPLIGPFNPYFQAVDAGRMDPGVAAFGLATDMASVLGPSALRVGVGAVEGKLILPGRTLYRGTTYFDALETVDQQAINGQRLAHFQVGTQYELGPGLYMSDTLDVATRYASRSGVRGGGPGVLQIEIGDLSWSWLEHWYGARANMPIARETGLQDFVPSAGIGFFNRRASFSQLPFGTVPRLGIGQCDVPQFAPPLPPLFPGGNPFEYFERSAGVRGADY